MQHLSSRQCAAVRWMLTVVGVFVLVGPGLLTAAPPEAPKARLLGEAGLLKGAAADRPLTIEVKLDGHTFTLPEGFTIERVAGPPLVDRPIVGDFDEQGRLYVADSSGSNEKTDVQLKTKPHRIVRLEDTDGDGTFDKLDRLRRQDDVPRRGDVAATARSTSPRRRSIWKLTDTDGDGVADQREVWFDGKTLTGCANDLHGPYLGPDGWIYWCKGAFAKQTYTLPDGKTFTTRAVAHLPRRPDGTGDRAGDDRRHGQPGRCRLHARRRADLHDDVLPAPRRRPARRPDPRHLRRRLRQGPRPDPRAGPQVDAPQLMPVLTHMGPAAPCGLHRYESRPVRSERRSTVRDNLFACQFNLRKVSRHVLRPEGATFATQDSDFLVSDNLDFHPTDVIEDADGSLLVVDTGGWYKLCCRLAVGEGKFFLYSLSSNKNSSSHLWLTKQPYGKRIDGH